MTYYGRWTYKFEEAARRGAIGALIVHETEGAGYGWNIVQSAAGENFNIVLPPDAQQPVLLQGWIQATGRGGAVQARGARPRGGEAAGANGGSSSQSTQGDVLGERRRRPDAGQRRATSSAG